MVLRKVYGIDISTFQRWLQRYRQTGRAAPLPRGHNRAALDDSQMRRLDEFVLQTPDATLEQLRTELGVTCSLVAIHNALKRLGYRYKKRYGPANKNVPTSKSVVKHGLPSRAATSAWYSDPP